jgi:hypothetical protein
MLVQQQPGISPLQRYRDLSLQVPAGSAAALQGHCQTHAHGATVFSDSMVHHVHVHSSGNTAALRCNSFTHTSGPRACRPAGPSTAGALAKRTRTLAC